MSDHETAPTGRRATLADVAAAADVALSTASRALSTPGRGSPATRERIERVAREIGYTSSSGRNGGRSRVVAVLVSDVTNPFYFGIIRGTQQALRVAGYSQLLVHTEESDEMEESMLAELRGSYDGAILAASRLSDKRLAQLSAQTPIVALNRAVPGVPSVFIDTPHGFDQAMEHLASLGHRRICYVAGPTNSWASDLRWRAVTSAAKRLGLECVRVGPFSPRKNAGAAAADAALNTGATACVAFNDLLAIGMLMRLRERGVRVPEDMSIVGCDDIFGADFCSPPLTTLTAPIEQAARMAVAILFDRLQAERTVSGVPRHRQAAVLPTHLTVRASTGPVADAGSGASSSRAGASSSSASARPSASRRGASASTRGDR
ncbi:LacI family transcriptional regulator [Microbacterium resistens]|uniref:LacI family transcriptional regulator n=1 Tax=Microbacterium resistens TaxID=156977 RepID=A0ABU1SDZ8_9MICO|nr:LacI family DNA-binding transcriptional regulator [Microbacterium resistens]MDR6867112.1 LacI family transcriptional regulator [Microbacterium resistens]